MSLATIALKFEEFAAEVINDAKNEGVSFLVHVAADAEAAFESLVEKVGADAAKFVTDLMSDDSLSGVEKANLAATQLVDQYAQQGVAIAAHDASTIIKNTFLAVQSAIQKL